VHSRITVYSDCDRNDDSMKRLSFRAAGLPLLGFAVLGNYTGSTAKCAAMLSIQLMTTDNAHLG
jgi:hypothetical protein